MEERRTFVGWIKCPIEFSKKFNYVKFNTDSSLYKYDGFYRIYRERHHTENTIVLNFRRVFLSEDNELELGYIKQFHPGWYNKATHFTEEEVKEYLTKEKIENSKPKKEETKSWFAKLFFIIAVLLVSCERQPEFYIKGKPCYTTRTCVKEELKLQPYGPRFAMECVKWKTDTVECHK